MRGPRWAGCDPRWALGSPVPLTPAPRSGLCPQFPRVPLPCPTPRTAAGALSWWWALKGHGFDDGGSPASPSCCFLGGIYQGLLLHFPISINKGFPELGFAHKDHGGFRLRWPMLLEEN